jgi:CO/xanthine dehydrogenase Mo-binding subunit
MSGAPARSISPRRRTRRHAEPGPFGGPTETATGDFDGAFATAPIKLDATYTTPDQAHAMMEPHAPIASWEGDRLTCRTSIQQMNWGVRDLAKALGIPRENVRLVSPYIGGGFGGKGTVQSDLVLAALAARAAGRPGKVTLQRALMFNNTIHRPATIQRIRIGATRDGRITAIGHESWSGINHDLAGYEVAIHADVPHQEVIFLEEVDPTMSPMKAKGVGELGLCGVAPAIANAIYNATGVRVRDYPITLDKFLDRLPEVG